MKSISSSRGPRARPKAGPKLFLHNGSADPDLPIPRVYDKAFVVTPAYRASLPDLMQASDAIHGANVPVQQVGVSNFKLPLKFAGGARGPLTLEASVMGSVSLDANVKGINMSRIVRSFYEHKDELFTPELLRKILLRYRREVGALSARLRVSFSYPILQKSLRSGLAGYQYYSVVFEGRLERDGTFRRFVEFDFVYSSACPCSAELAEHARTTRGTYALAHSQRSKARLRVEVADRKKLTVENLHAHCLRGLQTETQVMVKREDEQAFAELNGSDLKFVEDAARLLYQQLQGDARIRDFQIACAHEESLHSHDAVSVICKGLPGGMNADFDGFRALVGVSV